MRILFERRFGTDEEVAKLRQQLLDARNGDGAWGWEKGAPSDALTTGLAIYVLAKVQAGDDSSVFRDARKWLLASQQSDGSWLTPSKNFTKPTSPEQMKVRDEIYRYWGTAWATIAPAWAFCSPGARPHRSPEAGASTQGRVLHPGRSPRATYP